MAVEIHYGDYSLRDDLVLGWRDLDCTPSWGVQEQDAFRSAQKYARGVGNFSCLVRFEVVSRHTNYFDRVNFERAIPYLLFGGDLVRPRELWFLDTAINPLPFSFGQCIPKSAKPIAHGHDGTGFMLTMEYEFLCGVLALDTGLSTESSLTLPSYMPNLWIPNAYGVVLRRTSDDAYIKWTRDFGTLGGDHFEILDSDPGTTDYDIISTDLEWTDPSNGFGFFQTSPSSKYELQLLDNLGPSRAPQAGTADTDFASSYTTAKGIIFASGKGPILRSTATRRFRLNFGATNSLEYELL